MCLEWGGLAACPRDFAGRRTTNASLLAPASDDRVVLGEPDTALGMVDEAALVRRQLLGRRQRRRLCPLCRHLVEAFEADDGDPVVDIRWAASVVLHDRFESRVERVVLDV
jgi:hypothetical protein